MTAALILLAALSADVTVSTRLEPPVIPFHKQARYTVVAEGPKELGIQLPDMVDHLGGLAVSGLPEYRQETVDDGVVRITETYTLEAIQPQLYAIGPAVVTWGEDGRREVASPALLVRELTPEEIEEAQQFDSSVAIPDLQEPSVFLRWQLWAAVVVLLAVVAAIVAFRRRGPSAKPAPAPKKPWDVAYDRLRILDEQKLPERGVYEPYYVDLSSILRYYIEDRFHIHAPEQTTQEFLNELGDGQVLNDAQQQMMGQFLRHCDRVKFAQYEPTKNEMEKSFTRVLEFVDETVPKEAPAGRDAA